MIYDTLEKQLDAAWINSYEKFFCRKTCLFYDYLTSLDPAKRYAHLPTPEEIAASIPNRTSWNSGMEDSMINAGIMMECVVNRYSVTGEESMRERALEIFRGMCSCIEIPANRGFLARSLSPIDGKSYYMESSRDQYTHYIQGLFRYFYSPLADSAVRAKIREIMRWIADFMIRTVKPETGWNFEMANGESSESGVSKVWNRNSWADARLPMFYGAAWNLTQDETYLAEFRKYAHEAIERTLRMPLVTIEGFLAYQIQCSLEIIRMVAVDDDVLRKKCERAMLMTAEHAVFYAWQTRHHENKTDFSILFPDWRDSTEFYGKKPYRIPLMAPEVREAFEKLRNSFQTMIVQLMAPGWNISEFQKRLFVTRLREIDFENCNNCGILYPVAAYWKARACGLLTEEECLAAERQ